jgi:hypothetical protein
MEDVIMSDIKEENKEIKENTVYQDYKKALLNIDKALTLKDNKTLYLYFRQLNKYRREFNDDDISYICDNFLRHKYHFRFISELTQKVLY